MKKKVAVKTGIGKGYGSGHAQRSLTLVKALKDSGLYDARLVMPCYPSFFSADIKELYSDNIPPDSGLIIRDMRDSSAEEIDHLKTTAPVLAVDDIGPGRYSSDFVIDLLPNPLHSDDDSCYSPELFLFSGDFIRGINMIGDKKIDKSIDIAFYPGYQPDSDYIEAVTGMIPDGYSVALLTAGEPVFLSGGKSSPLYLSYPEILASSKVLITHFGITLYEGSLCGCGPVLINPSEYHSSLSAIASKKIPLTELGLFRDFDKQRWGGIITKILSEREYPPVYTGIVKERIDRSTKGFVDFINRCFR